MHAGLRTALAAAGLAMATQAVAQVSFYEHDNFQGRNFTTQKQIGNFERYGFNDRASSVVVVRDRWEVCEDARFDGRCVVLRPGRYPSLAAMGLNNRVSSVRIVRTNARVEDARYAPAGAPIYDSRRRRNERLYEANVTSVRAVVASSGQRCWIEHEQVRAERGGPNIPGAIVGALVGGILGHQVGGGRGRDIATAGGAVGGAAMGAHMGGSDRREGYGADVQHCSGPSEAPRAEYWDVVYTFHGEEHRMQTTAPPGPTVTVNEHGEPRS